MSRSTAQGSWCDGTNSTVLGGTLSQSVPAQPYPPQPQPYPAQPQPYPGQPYPPQPYPPPAPVQVMILGTYHFGNPGLDLHNMKSESVLTPGRQKELDDIATRLAKFNPTKIAVEARSDRPRAKVRPLR